MSNPILRACDLATTYGKIPVWQSLSFSLKPGVFLGVLGPNGSGKSTLLKCLCGLRPINQGKLYLNGDLLSSYSGKQLARKVAMVSCNPARPTGMKLQEYVLLGRLPWLAWSGFYSKSDREIALTVLDLLNIRHYATKTVETLSAGQWQMATLARALTQIWTVPAPLLLLDEPSANLDINARMTLFQIMYKFLGRGWTIIAAMHDCNLAALFCDSLLGLNNGRQTFFGPVCNVYTPENLYALYDWPLGTFFHPDAKRNQVYPRLAGDCIADPRRGNLR